MAVRAKNAAQAGISEWQWPHSPLGTGPQLCNQVLSSPAILLPISGSKMAFSATCTTEDISF